MSFNQAESGVRCEWGEQGVRQLAPDSHAVIIVDVLSFSTCIDIATGRGALVFPYRWQDESAAIFAQRVDAAIAHRRGNSRYSLSPASLLTIKAGTRLVLPSPNGSSLSLMTGETPTLAGCLRNCRAVALAAMDWGQRIAVIPAGEKWPDGSLRPCFEDLVGAGAIISYLGGDLSPEAQLAVATYQGVQQSLQRLMGQCGSGKELAERGFGQDVDLASALNISDCVPMLIKGAYVNQASQVM